MNDGVKRCNHGWPCVWLPANDPTYAAKGYEQPHPQGCTLCGPGPCEGPILRYPPPVAGATASVPATAAQSVPAPPAAKLMSGQFTSTIQASTHVHSSTPQTSKVDWGEARGPWHELVTGRIVHAYDLRPEEVDLEDIATQLAGLGRFGCDRYRVAEHAVRVSQLVESWHAPTFVCLRALHHDDAEAYTPWGDMLAPYKRDPRLAEVIESTEDNLMQAIVRGLPLPVISAGWRDMIKSADTVMLLTEARDILPSRGNWSWAKSVQRLPRQHSVRMQFLGYEDARAAYLARHYQLLERMERGEP